MTRFLIAPNAFKHGLNAQKAAEAIEKGLLKSKLKCQTQIFPVGDGGDGTCALIHKKLRGTYHTVTVTDPLGRKISAPISLIHKGETALIEMADASGIHLMKNNELNPLMASSTGTGELIKAALDFKVNQIIIGMGGSATVDGGCGILHALGVRFLDKHRNLLKPRPKELRNIAYIDSTNLDKRLSNCSLTILCDVHNKLLGKHGAAQVFGPQKGADKKDVVLLEHFLKKWTKTIKAHNGKEIANLASGGTAGGAAAGLFAFTKTSLVDGIDYFLKLTHFVQELEKTDYIITGEGSIDEQTLSGKAPYGVAKIAKKHNIPCIALGGAIPLQPSEKLKTYFDVLLPINHQLAPLHEALINTAENLERTGETIGNTLML